MQDITIYGQRLLLHPHRVIYWPAGDALLAADLHLGKGAHFRRAGIGVPTGVGSDNFRRLEEVMLEFRPARFWLLGDLFHSDYNHVWERFGEFLAHWGSTRFELVPGNHDILPQSRYHESGLHLRKSTEKTGPFYLSHHPKDETAIPEDGYLLAGHVHPCVRLHTPGRRGTPMRMPAFYFGRRMGLLPAFGEFTGCHPVEVREGDQVFVPVEEEVIAV